MTGQEVVSANDSVTVAQPSRAQYAERLPVELNRRRRRRHGRGRGRRGRRGRRQRRRRRR